MRNMNPIFWVVLIGLFFLFGCGDQNKNDLEEHPNPENKADQMVTESPYREAFHVLSYDGTRGLRYLVHFGLPGTDAILYTYQETLLLSPQVTASGSKYRGERITIWTKGDEVLMEVDGKRVGPCAVSALQPILEKAWRGGADFWAVGNEPSWNLVMGRDRVILLTNQGQDHFEFPGLKAGQLNARIPEGEFVYSHEGHELKVELINELCTNIMSGEPFAVSVRLTFDGQEMTGCGTGLF